LLKYLDLQVRPDRMAESLRIAGANCGSGRVVIRDPADWIGVAGFPVSSLGW